MDHPLKIVYFGSSGSLSTLPLRALLRGPHELVAVVVHEPALQTNKLAVVAFDDSSSVKALAFQHKINIIYFAQSFSDVETKLAETPFDTIVTSCFARKIPSKILALPRMGAINLHPSLLPKFRGPDPVFWQLRNAVSESGVTLHLMSNTFDEGFIIAQQRVNVSQADTLVELNEKLAQLGACLLVELLADLDSGIRQAQPQNEGLSSYQIKPVMSDYELFDEWDASRVAYFVQATLGRVPYYPIRLKGKVYKILRVLDYHGSISRKLTIFGKKLYFPCRTGHVCAEILTD